MVTSYEIVIEYLWILMNFICAACNVSYVMYSVQFVYIFLEYMLCLELCVSHSIGHQQVLIWSWIRVERAHAVQQFRTRRIYRIVGILVVHVARRSDWCNQR